MRHVSGHICVQYLYHIVPVPPFAAAVPPCTTVPLYHIYHSSWLLCHTVIMNPVHCRPKTMVYWICDRSRLLLIKSVISLGDDKPSLLMPGRVGCDRSHAHQIDARAPTA